MLGMRLTLKEEFHQNLTNSWVEKGPQATGRLTRDRFRYMPTKESPQ